MQSRLLAKTWHCSLLVVAVGCGTDHPDEDGSVPLPTASDPIVLEADLVIGRMAGANDDFIHPIVSGVDATGSVYVFDVRLRELRKFSVDGNFERLIAGPGEGPGQFRTPSVSIIVDSSTIYVREQQGGRTVTFSDSGQLLDDATAAGLRDINGTAGTLEGISSQGGIILRLRQQDPPPASAARPTTRFRFVQVTPGKAAADTFYTYEIPQNQLSLSGGRTNVVIPGPALGPSVSYDASSNELVRLDRPSPESAEAATFTIQRLSRGGQVLHSRSFHRKTFPVEQLLADSLLARIQRVGKLGGGDMYRTLEVDELRRVVGWPDYYPAVEQLLLSDDGEAVWLKMSAPIQDEYAEWYIFDRQFNPVQRVRLPKGLAYPKVEANAIWGTLLDDYSSVVARFQVPPAEASRSDMR